MLILWKLWTLSMETKYTRFEFIDEWAYETMISGLSTDEFHNSILGTLQEMIMQHWFLSQTNSQRPLHGIQAQMVTAVFSLFNNVEISFLWLEDLNEDTFDDIITWGQGTSGELLISDDLSGTYVSSTQSGLDPRECNND